MPVPGSGTEIILTAADAEDGGITEVLGLSLLLGAPSPSATGSTLAPPGCSALSPAWACPRPGYLLNTQYRAYNLYYGSVTPDD